MVRANRAQNDRAECLVVTLKDTEMDARLNDQLNKIDEWGLIYFETESGKIESKAIGKTELKQLRQRVKEAESRSDFVKWI